MDHAPLHGTWYKLSVIYFKGMICQLVDSDTSQLVLDKFPPEAGMKYKYHLYK